MKDIEYLSKIFNEEVIFEESAWDMLFGSAKKQGNRVVKMASEMLSLVGADKGQQAYEDYLNSLKDEDVFELKYILHSVGSDFMYLVKSKIDLNHDVINNAGYSPNTIKLAQMIISNQKTNLLEIDPKLLQKVKELFYQSADVAQEFYKNKT